MTYPNPWYPGDVTNPKVIEQMEYIVNKAKANGIVVGTFIDEPDSVDFGSRAEYNTSPIR